MERRIYEQAAKEEEAYLLEDFGEVLDRLPRPVGSLKKKGRGRPRKERGAAAEEYVCRSMMLVLLLQARHELQAVDGRVGCGGGALRRWDGTPVYTDPAELDESAYSRNFTLGNGYSFAAQLSTRARDIRVTG